MFFILSTLARKDQIRSANRHAGRLFHVRIIMMEPLDILGVRQHAWNIQKEPLQEDPVDQPGGSKTGKQINYYCDEGRAGNNLTPGLQESLAEMAALS